MSNPYIFGGLTRAVNDDTTIDEAIFEATVAHNDDPDAHLGEGGALTSHRAAEVIDHLAESVVNDKLATLSRRYIAIVDPNSPNDFDTIASAVAYAKDKGGGDVLIARGDHYVTEPVPLPPTVSLYGMGRGETRILSDAVGDALFPAFSYYRPSVNSSNNCVAITGTPNVTLPDITSGEAPTIVGCMVTVHDGVGYATRLITSWVSGTTFATTGANMTAGTGISNNFNPAVYMVNGSAAVTSMSFANSGISALIKGYELFGAGAGSAGFIVDVDGVGGATLATAFAGTTGYYTAYSSFSAAISTDIQNISFIFSDALGVWVSDGEFINANFLGCEFNVPYYICVGSDATANFTDCLVHILAGTNWDPGHFSVFSNCLFWAEAANTTAFDSMFDTRFVSCRWQNWLPVDWSPLTAITNGCIFQDCIIEGQITKTLNDPFGSGNPTYGMISGCRVILKTNNTLTISGTKYVVDGNTFTNSTTPIVLNGTSKWNVVTDNILNGGLTDAGTENQVKGNVDEGCTKLYALTGAGTACDFIHHNIVTHTPTGSHSLTTTIPPAGETRVLKILTTGVTTFTMTFSTGFHTTATLVTGAVASKTFVLTFVSDGTTLHECSRTAAY